jgi:methyl-accepting chemotaxis protein
MSPKKHYKRKTYFINKELQGKFIFHYFILLALGSLLFIVIFSFFSSNTLSIVYDNYHLQLGMTPKILFKKILNTQWLFIIVGGLVIAFITLRLTHRIAGPFYRFERTIEAMIDGNVSCTIVLRAKDEGKDLAEKINTFNSKLSRDLAGIDDLNAKIGNTADSLQKKLETDKRPEKLMELVETIIQHQKKIDTKIRTYQFNNRSQV